MLTMIPLLFFTLLVYNTKNCGMFELCIHYCEINQAREEQVFRCVGIWNV